MSGHVSLVTGGAQGIGAAVASRLARRGDNVWLADLEDKRVEAEDLAAEVGGQFVALDVAEPSSVERVVKGCEGLDVLVNCAGITIPGEPVDEVTPEHWNAQMTVNLTGTWLCLRAAAASMRQRGWGRIVNLASGLATRGMAGSAAYAASKAGVTGLTRAAAADLAPHGITVNSVSPGYVDTPMTQGFPEALRAARLAEIGMGRFADPDEIARRIAWRQRMKGRR